MKKCKIPAPTLHNFSYFLSFTCHHCQNRRASRATDNLWLYLELLYAHKRSHRRPEQPPHHSLIGHGQEAGNKKVGLVHRVDRKDQAHLSALIEKRIAPFLLTETFLVRVEENDHTQAFLRRCSAILFSCSLWQANPANELPSVNRLPACLALTAVPCRAVPCLDLNFWLSTPN